MSFTLKPTRMSVSDLRPSLSYRVGVPAASRNVHHWVELVLASDPGLFHADARDQRQPDSFATFATRFPLIGEAAIIHVPPATLLALAQGDRIYAGAALFNADTGGAPLSIIQPDADSVYVSASGFTGAGISQRFGFAGRPGLTGSTRPETHPAPTWAGDLPQPNAGSPGPASPTPTSSPPAPAPDGAGPITEGSHPMTSQQFMHQNTRHSASQPQPHPMGAMDYDDGFGAPPPAMTPQSHSMGGLPYGGGGMKQPLAQPYEYVLPEFDSYNPLEIIGTLKDAWGRYKSFTAGVADTSTFPFSAIVLLRMHAKHKADPSRETTFLGTGFYIASDLILTAAHNMAEDASWSEAYKIDVFVGMNSKNGAGGALDPDHALAAYSVNQSDWTINEHYTTNPDAHDIAVIRVGVAPPDGNYFRIADHTPGEETKIAVCGYAGSSRAQDPSTGFKWQKLLPTAKGDGKQHLDADRIRGKLAGGEAITYNLHTLRGTSGSPVFVQPQQSLEQSAAVEQMQIVAVHRRSRREDEPNTNFENVGVLLTPRKKEWALAGGQMSIPLEYGARPMGTGYAEPMLEPASWVAIGTAAAGLAGSAGIAALNSSDGDIAWELQKMEGWLKPNEHPTPTVPEDVPPNTISETTFVNIKSPEYQGTLQGDMYAHFYLRFRWDNTGVGGIVIDKRPYDTKDNLTGGMHVSMQIVPLLETFPSTDDPNHQVAGVEVIMQYSYTWTVSNSDHVKVIYRFYGDGTYESRVVGGAQTLVDNSLTWSPQSRT